MRIVTMPELFTTLGPKRRSATLLTVRSDEGDMNIISIVSDLSGVNVETDTTYVINDVVEEHYNIIRFLNRIKDIAIRILKILHIKRGV